MVVLRLALEVGRVLAGVGVLVGLYLLLDQRQRNQLPDDVILLACWLLSSLMMVGGMILGVLVAESADGHLRWSPRWIAAYAVGAAISCSGIAAASTVAPW